jgi:hypothetical protein
VEVAPSISILAILKAVPIFYSDRERKESTETNRRARIRWESDNHLLSSFKRSKSSKDKLWNFDGRKSMLLTIGVVLNMRSEKGRKNSLFITDIGVLLLFQSTRASSLLQGKGQRVRSCDFKQRKDLLQTIVLQWGQHRAELTLESLVVGL